MSNQTEKDASYEILALLRELKDIDEKVFNGKNAKQAKLEDGRTMMFYGTLPIELMQRRTEIL